MASKKKTVVVESAPVAEIGLAAIVAATQTAGFLMVPNAEASALAAEGLVELNAGVTNGDNIATRATQKGIDSMATNKTANVVAPQASAVDTSAPNEGKLNFEIEDGVEVPVVIGRGRTGSTYPFDKLNVGQSFFVPKSPKNLASTISSAQNRFAEVVPGEVRKNRKGIEVPKTQLTRKFTVRAAKKGDVEGSRIWRTA